MPLPPSRSSGSRRRTSPVLSLSSVLSPLPGARHLSRRELILLSGTALASFSLFGCGGGGGDSATATLNFGRTQPVGSLTDQILQYSNSADRLSSMWQTQSDDINFMTNFTATNRSRAETGWEIFFQATYYGLLGLQAVYERFASQFAEMDNLGYLGEKVTALNSLKGTNALNNPQWLLAMMERGQEATATFGYILEALQKNGLGELVQTVRETTEPTEQLIAYGILTEIFNGWVTKIAARVQYPLDPTWLLDVGDATPVTNAVLLKELDRVPDIVSQLPFGPGFNATSTARSTSTRADDPIIPTVELPSIIGVFLENIQATLENPKKVKEILFEIKTSLDDYTRRIDFNKTNISAFLRKNLIKELTKDLIKKIVVKTLTAWKGKLLGIIADCVIEILDKSIDLAKYFSGTIATLEVLPLAIVFATLSALQIRDILIKIKECLDMIQKNLPGPPPPLILRGTVTIEDYPTPVRVPFVKVLTGETDQIRRNRVLKGKVTTNRRKPPKLPVGLMAVAGKLDPSSSNTSVKGTVTTTNVSGQIVSMGVTGQVVGTSGGSLPGRSASRAADNLFMIRTYEGVEISMILLMIDLMNRFPDQLEPAFTADGEGIGYNRSDLATLLRRESGSTEAMVPAIASAQLLCTAPGFVPQNGAQSADLTTSPTLASLIAAASLSPGGNVNVK